MDLASNSSMAGVREMVQNINPTIEFDQIDEVLTIRMLSNSSFPSQGSRGGSLYKARQSSSLYWEGLCFFVTTRK